MLAVSVVNIGPRTFISDIISTEKDEVMSVYSSVVDSQITHSGIDISDEIFLELEINYQWRFHHRVNHYDFIDRELKELEKFDE
jgi:hypothetical protein